MPILPQQAPDLPRDIATRPPTKHDMRYANLHVHTSCIRRDPTSASSFCCRRFMDPCFTSQDTASPLRATQPNRPECRWKSCRRRYLETALRQLCHFDRPRTIWMDTVAINQRGVQERNAQVRRMTDIYRGAARVIIWIGTATDDSILALSTSTRSLPSHWNA
jgi:hypothetical protein